MCNTYTDCAYGWGICHQMSCQKFHDCEVEMVVMQQLITQDRDLCQQVTEQLLPWYKFLNCGGDCVEK